MQKSEREKKESYADGKDGYLPGSQSAQGLGLDFDTPGGPVQLRRMRKNTKDKGGREGRKEQDLKQEAVNLERGVAPRLSSPILAYRLPGLDPAPGQTLLINPRPILGQDLLL